VTAANAVAMNGSIACPTYINPTKEISSANRPIM